MLNKLEIHNCFAHKKSVFDFTTGMTKIEGANESGKSLIFEMIRYALFGTKALRGEAADYKKTEVKLNFTVGDKTYEVYRGPKDVTLYQGKTFVARSTSAVNAKIIEIIGYGLKTFDNVNSMVQNQVEKLTTLSAPERKKFVDGLIGADQIDSLISEYSGEAKVAAAQAVAYQGSLLTADKPEKPNGYKDMAKELADSKARLDELNQLEGQRNLLRKQLDNFHIVPDPHPDLDGDTINGRINEAEAAQARRRSVDGTVLRLAEEGFVIQDFTKFLETCAVLRQLEQVRTPRLTREEIEATLHKHTANRAWIEVTALRAKVAELESCPRCGKTFDDEKAPLIARINELSDLARPHTSLPSEESLREMEQAWDSWEDAELKRTQLDDGYVALARHVNNMPLFTEAQWDEAKKVVEVDFNIPRTYHQSLNIKRQIAERDALQAQYDGMKSLDIELPEALAAYNEAYTKQNIFAAYDAAMKSYEAVQVQNKKVMENIKQAEAEAEQAKAIQKALTEFKYYVNTHFLPAVARACSTMLSTMTNGRRRKVEITDKFEITVDGTKVEKFSGSAKALVNIALRLSLQYVLTKNSFSVFMGDEIDASMDEERAKYLSECLNNMTSHIKQIVVISHKDISADRKITL